jgi:hypothetical protein
MGQRGRGGCQYQYWDSPCGYSREEKNPPALVKTKDYLLESSIALSRGDPVADESGKHSWVL